MNIGENMFFITLQNMRQYQKVPKIQSYQNNRRLLKKEGCRAQE